MRIVSRQFIFTHYIRSTVNNAVTRDATCHSHFSMQKALLLHVASKNTAMLDRSIVTHFYAMLSLPPHIEDDARAISQRHRQVGYFLADFCHFYAICSMPTFLPYERGLCVRCPRHGIDIQHYRIFHKNASNDYVIPLYFSTCATARPHWRVRAFDAFRAADISFKKYITTILNGQPQARATARQSQEPSRDAESRAGGACIAHATCAARAPRPA